MIFFSSNLMYLRKSVGWKQVDLAVKLGVKPNTISNYEKGITSPGFDVIRKITQIFKVTVDKLLYTRLDDGGIDPIYDGDPDELEIEISEDIDGMGEPEEISYRHQSLSRRFEPADRGIGGRTLKSANGMSQRPEADYRDEKIRDLEAQLVKKDRIIMDLSRQLGGVENELKRIRDAYESVVAEQENRLPPRF